MASEDNRPLICWGNVNYLFSSGIQMILLCLFSFITILKFNSVLHNVRPKHNEKKNQVGKQRRGEKQYTLKDILDYQKMLTCF